MMSSEEVLYVKGAKIWLPNAEEVWESATLEQNYQKGLQRISVMKDSGRVVEIELKEDGSNLPPLRNPSILIGQNDLTSLSYLHEPGVLYNLKVRFCERQIIYTYCGIILIAINPYTELPLYGPSIIRAYRGRSIGQLEPHIFALAEEAYAKLERENCNLSIIVSGESGAGKTVSAKYAMRYFAAVGGSESETQVERKVLASSPIMEAFGNAKTIRNDNSSRFGKFTKLLFKNNMDVMNLTGATMHTYLLEKSRVVFQAQGERNYHILYQLCAARELHPELILDHQSKFEYLNQGDSPNIDRVSDKDQYNETIQAMLVLGFNTYQIDDIIKILAGILHLGNIKFAPMFKKDSEEIDPDGCEIFADDLHLRVTGEMFGVDADELRKWLITRQIESANEHVLIPNSIDAAQSARDALAKHVYAKLFQYIVSVINKSLNMGRMQNSFIGVLDIYGFETFDVNSFEQFCINYANEKLQQQFNQHVFKLEQEEYLKEGITWTMIDFYDNQPCINLIESKLGVLDLLDEECKMPKGSDENWAGKLIEKCSKFPHFEKPRFGSTSFSIKHFSDIVKYDVHGFLEKNRDTVSKELVNVIRQSQMSLCRQLIEMEEVDTLKANSNKTFSLGGRVVISPAKHQVQPSKQHRRSVGSQFRESLSSLIETLHSTTPHYVRCIKPNDDKISFKWEAPKIVQQLRACGVLETVRISAAGFPSRWSYHDFYMRYQLLVHRSEANKNNLQESCRSIVQKWIVDKEKYRFGNTQIFFRAGQVAYLEQVRSDLRKKYITIIQATVRRFIYRRRYVKLQKTILGIQRYARGYLARQKVQIMREERAAVLISKYIRGWICRHRYQRLRRSICGIQQYARGMLARRRFQLAMDHHRAIQIQRFVRGYLARRAYQKRRHDIIICQSAVRRYLARKQFKNMKVEAKTISYMQKMYKGLENKIISMQQKIDELNRENNNLKHKTSEISVLKMKLEVKKALESEVKALKMQLAEKEKTLVSVNKQLEAERDEKALLIEERSSSREEWKQQLQLLRNENDELRKKVEAMNEMTVRVETQKPIPMRRMAGADAQRARKDSYHIENGGDFSYYRSDDDIGYSSANNTLDLQHSRKPPAEATPEAAKSDQTTLLLKLRNILEEEKKKNRHLNDNLEKMMNRNKPTEDSIRVSELEVENEKLRHDYELLRNSVQRGVEMQELEAQYQALQEELRRRREECIQLKAVLQQQSQTMNSLNSSVMASKTDGKNIQNNELLEAFHSQKLVNRQLESELSALTEENNAHLRELSRQIDDLRHEKTQLENLLHSGLDNIERRDIEALSKNERYLRYELERSMLQYTKLQEEMNAMTNKFDAIKNAHEKIMYKLGDGNVTEADTTLNKNISNAMEQANRAIKTNYTGVMKFRREDSEKIVQRLVTGMTTRIAIGLLPGFSAYVLFMCIRYTDLINSDDDVRDLLSKFVMQMKKIHRNANAIETRVLWLMNSVTLLNLLRQYGDVEEYVKFNTETQNQQQLKNFNLAEYRKVVLDIIFNLYQVLVKQIQQQLEPYIVPGILDNDEIQRTRQMPNAITADNNASDSKPAPWKQLIVQLEHYYKTFHYFGLERCYAEQIFRQLFYFICAISMNYMMLSGDICMWENGMIIRYNIGYLENWVRGKKMSNDVLVPLAPLNQVSQLLQSRKTEEDVETIRDLCTHLNTAQVLKIMKSYKLDDYEAKITNTFLEKLKVKLSERSPIKSEEFTMDQNFIHPFHVVFKYSDKKLENIELPKSLNLDEVLVRI